MGQPQDDELSGLRSELEGDPDLADTFARLEPGSNRGRSMSGQDFADPLAGLVPLDAPEPSTKLRAPSGNPPLPKLHGEDEGDRDTPTQRYVKTLHDLPDPSTRRVGSDPAPPVAEAPKPLRTPSSYVGRIPRAPISSPEGGPAVPAGVPMRRPSGQNPMLSYSGSGRSLPQAAPVHAGALHPMSPENRFGAPTESQAASTLPAPERASSVAKEAVTELPRSSTLPGAKGIVDSQSVPSTAVSPGVSAPASVPMAAAVEGDSAQESTDAGVSAPTELSAEAEGSEGDAVEANTKSSGRGAIYLAVGILSAAATLAVLLFVVKPMRAGAGSTVAAGSSAVPLGAAPSALVAPSVAVPAEAAPSSVVAPGPSVSATAASITADPVIVAGSASPSGGSSSAGGSTAVPSVTAAPPVPSMTVTTVVVAPVPSPVVTAKPHSTGTAPTPKPTGSKMSPIFDF